MVDSEAYDSVFVSIPDTIVYSRCRFATVVVECALGASPTDKRLHFGYTGGVIRGMKSLATAPLLFFSFFDWRVKQF